MTTHTHLSHPTYRSDIDGLRALAVLSVVIFHAFPKYLPGGFVGVDVFFVISGFLISTIILENLRAQTFSFAEFYARRIKRIFPALLLVLVSSYLFGWFALLADEYQQLGKHIAAGAGFVSNFALLSESGYFDNSAELKPLLHLWSLGIEEQFYIVWPLLLWAVTKIRLNILTITVLVGLGSFVMNIEGLRKSAIAVFYSPQTRVWELLIGAVIAYVLLNKDRFSALYAGLTSCISKIIFENPTKKNTDSIFTIYSLVGLLALLLGFVLINKTKNFPGTWALLPTLGAAMLLITGPSTWVARRILSIRLLVWIGLISYPLYLWHWPLLSFARIIEGETPSAAIRSAAVVLAIGLAWLTYVLVERPVRFKLKNKITPVILLILMLGTGAVGYSTYINDGFDFRNKIYQQNKTQIKYQESFYDNALCRKAYPEFKGFYCVKTASSDPTIQILGDSHANRLVMGLTRFTDQNILQVGHHGCPPFMDVEAVEPGIAKDECAPFTNKAIDIAINTDSIKTVVMTFAGAKYIGNGRYFQVSSGGRSKPSDVNEIIVQAMRKTLDALEAKNKKIIFILDNPEISFDPNTCIDDGRPLRLLKRDLRRPCAVKRADFENAQREYRSLILSVLKYYPKVTVMDASDALCDSEFCYALKDGAILYHGRDHLSLGGSILVGREIQKKLTE